MVIRKGLLIIISLVLSHAAFADKGNRILIVLDGSSSMLEQWDKDHNRFNAASSIILRLMDSVYQLNDEVEFGLRVYGHQHPAQDNDCYDSKLEVMFSRDNKTQMQLRLESLKPAGISPIAYSLEQAAEQDLINTDRYNYSIILITDGGESCNGNICDVARQLLNKKIAFKPYVVSLIDYKPLFRQYDCFGQYLAVINEPATINAIDTIIKEYRKQRPAKKQVAAEIKRDGIVPSNNKYIAKIPRLETASSKVIPNVIPLNQIKKIEPIEQDKGYGYLSTVGLNLTNIKLYKKTQTNLVLIPIMQSAENKQRIALKVGSYELMSTSGTISFEIRKNLITQIH